MSSNTTTTNLPTTMKAYQFSSTSPTLEANLALNFTAPLPPTAKNLKPDQVLIKIQYSSINAVDYKFAEIPILGPLITGRPSIPSLDFAGRVVALGAQTDKIPNTSELRVGQLVYGRLPDPTKFGTMAEYTVATRDGCVPIPEGVSVQDATALSTVGLTAYQSVIPKLEGGRGDGKRIFINGGSGGVGTYTIQIAKLVGLHVTTTCSTGNVELVRSLGADVVIDYKTVDLITELTKLPKFDIIVDNVGIPADLYWHAPVLMNPAASFVLVGAPAVTPGFLLGNLFKQFWPGWLGGGKRPWEFLQTTNKPEDYAVLSQWMAEGKLRAIIDEVFDATEDKEGPAKAYAKLRKGRTVGKILVKIADDVE